MLKNVIIVGLLAVLLCGASRPISDWANFKKEKCVINKNAVEAIFEDEKGKKTNIVLKGGKTIYMGTSYEEVSSEILKRN